MPTGPVGGRASSPAKRAGGHLARRIPKENVLANVPNILAAAQAALEAKNWEKAKEQIKMALALKPDDAKAAALGNEIDFAIALAAAQTAFEAKDWAKAKAQVKAAMALKPDDAKAVALGREINFSAALAAAQAAFEAKDWAKAKEQVKLALTLKPDEAKAVALGKEIDFSATLAAGDAALAAEEWDKAEAFMAAAQRMKPDDAKVVALAEKLKPTLVVTAAQNGKTVAGAPVMFGDQAGKTPARFNLERGKSYKVSVTLPGDGKKYALATTIVKCDRSGVFRFNGGTSGEQLMFIPAGCLAKKETGPEPYTSSRWAKAVVHEKTGMELVYIPAGTFVMGSPRTEPGRNVYETERQVTLTKGFYLGKSEVTQGQWEVIMGANPSSCKGAELPVENVSWSESQYFLRKLGPGARLPTEAEWESACRAGTTGPYAGTEDMDTLGWYLGNSEKTTHPVGQKLPNVWGLYDMHGNVWEWCSDWYEPQYPPGAVTDPPGSSSGSFRVCRGGSFNGSSKFCRSASRSCNAPSYRNLGLGFRVVLALPGE